MWDDILEVAKLVCAGGLLLGLIWVVVALIRALFEFRTVPEKHRLAIYRLGRWRRIAPPGPVILVRPIDTRTIEYDTTEQALSIAVNSLLLQDVPIGLRISCVSSFDPERTVSHDREKLTNILEMTEGSRMQRLGQNVRSVLEQEIADLFVQFPLSETPTIIEKLLPILPGTAQRKQLLEQIRRLLPGLLGSVGYRLNTEEPVVITDIVLTDSMLRAFEDRRTLDLVVEALRRNFPRLSEQMLAQMFSTVRGLEGIGTKIWNLYNEGGVQTAIREKDDDTTLIGQFPAQTGYETYFKPGGQPGAQVLPVPEELEHLTREDMLLLKSVPVVG